jgi:hypothetical protein
VCDVSNFCGSKKRAIKPSDSPYVADSIPTLSSQELFELRMTFLLIDDN